MPHLPNSFVDLLILDPPYNLFKNYNGTLFKEKGKREYQRWFQAVIEAVKPTLKSNASVYVCADWKTSVLIAPLLESQLRIRNRITWEREKGRGAKTNWKNNTEDIWFCTVSDSYYFKTLSNWLRAILERTGCSSYVTPCSNFTLRKFSRYKIESVDSTK